MERDKGLWEDFGGKWSDLAWVIQTGKTWDKLCYKLPKAKQSLPCVGGWYCIDADLRKTCQEKKNKKEKKRKKKANYWTFHHREMTLSPSLIEKYKWHFSNMIQTIQQFSKIKYVV